VELGYRYNLSGEYRINLFIFFACPKKTNQKKGHQSFAPLSAGYPVLLDPAGSLKTRFAQTVQTPFSAVSAVLGCMTME
jgi:hypothetical protein